MRERFGEHLLPLSRYQANSDIAVMLSWHSDGYGWLMVGWDHMAAGMDDGVAAGMDMLRKYASA